MDPRRLYSALVFIPLLYLGIRYSAPWLFSILISLVAIFALWEFLSLYFQQGMSSWAMKLLCFIAATIPMVVQHNISSLLIMGTVCMILIVLTGFVISPTETKQLVPSWIMSLFATVYVGLLLGHFVLLRNLEHGIALVFFAIVITWLSDIGGFFIGKSIGKHPLAPNLSPNKTIEGLVGGVVFSIVGAMLSHFWYTPFFSVGQCVILGTVLALIGAVGDLAESAIKRSAQVKDSGSIIPGHGGVLDRIDSLLLAGPTLYYYMKFLS